MLSANRIANKILDLLSDITEEDFKLDQNDYSYHKNVS